MELHQLRYVVAVARTGNFSQAAALCHVAQPSLSQQIQKLEGELGEPLFERLKRGIRTTPAGEAFVQRAARILEEVEAAGREVRESQAAPSGPLALGVLPTIAPYLLPRIVPGFIEAHSRVELIVQEDTTARLLQMLAACEIDLAIASPPIRDERFAVEELFTEELLLAIPPDHPLAARKRLRLADLEGERFILMKEGHCLGDQTLNFCTRRDFHPQVSCRSAQVETIQALVHAGLGISLVPAMAAGMSCAPQPVYRSLDQPRPQRAIGLVWLKQRALSRPADALREFTRKQLKTRRQ
jgi:LysR family hydrogen peroxide-inducible transcriptional activator